MNTTKLESKPLTEEQQKIAEIWREHDREMKAHHDNCNRVNNRILGAVHKLKGDVFFNDLIALMEWAEPSGLFELVSEPSGDMQSEDYGTIQRVWVDQWSVGDSGDSFSGHIYVKIKLRKFLKMHFEC